MIQGRDLTAVANTIIQKTLSLFFDRGASRSQIIEPADNEKAELKADEDEEEVKFSSDDEKKEKKPSLPRIMFGLFRGSFLLGMFYKLVYDCIMFVQPQLLR